MMDNTERIVCAAILYKDGQTHPHQPKNVSSGVVVCGLRHNNIIASYYALTGKPTRRETSIQGFLTTHNRFLDRIDANAIAIKAQQIFGNTEGDELISEDLY